MDQADPLPPLGISEVASSGPPSASRHRDKMTASRTRTGLPLSAPVPGTMAEALDAFEASTDIDPVQKKAIVADVRQAFQRQPGLATLEPNKPAVRFALHSFSDKRGKNIRANFRRILNWLHGTCPKAKQSKQPTLAWLKLLSATELERDQKIRLSRLSRWCSIRGLEPSDVTDETLSEFLCNLNSVGSLKEPKKLIDRTISAWNAAVVNVSGWPARRLTRSRERVVYKTPRLDQLGIPLANAITACLEALGAPSNVRDPSKKRFSRRVEGDNFSAKAEQPLKPTSIDSYGKYYRRAARIFSEDRQIPIEDVVFRDLVDPENVEIILNGLAEELDENQKGESSLHLMVCALCCAAKRYFHVDEDHMKELRHFTSQVEFRDATMTEKNVGRLRQLVLNKRYELMRLPAILINPVLAQIKREGKASLEVLVDAEVGVAIAVLLSVPVRASNLASTRVGVHLIMPSKKGLEGRLKFNSSETKNGEAIDRPIPADVVELLRAYIQTIVPLIRSNPGSNALFPGKWDDTTRGPAGLGTQLTKRIADHLMIEMNMHLFRHFASINYLEAHPGEYEVVRLLLGNRNLEVIKAHYTGVEKEAAFNKGDSVVKQQKACAGLNPSNMLESQSVNGRYKQLMPAKIVRRQGRSHTDQR